MLTQTKDPIHALFIKDYILNGIEKTQDPYLCNRFYYSLNRIETLLSDAIAIIGDDCLFRDGYSKGTMLFAIHDALNKGRYYR